MPDSEPPRLRILIAEDETIIRLDLRALLERAGFEVCAEARDGEEAVELARETQPEVAVLDVKMPRLDGIEARWVLPGHGEPWTGGLAEALRRARGVGTAR